MTTNPFHNGEDAKPDAAFRVAAPVERDGAVMLRLEGEFDLGAVSAFEAAAAAVPTSPRLIVDMRSLDYIDSSGISALLRLDARLAEGGGLLECVLPPEGAVRRVFDLVGLDETLSVREVPPV